MGVTSNTVIVLNNIVLPSRKITLYTVRSQLLNL